MRDDILLYDIMIVMIIILAIFNVVMILRRLWFGDLREESR